jgi:NAD(P)H-hydrate epimerase
MRAFDAYAMKECRVPSIVLMENAGRGATDVLCAAMLGNRVKNARITVVCGTGNNGGDGLVLARHLRLRGAHPRVLVCGAREKVSGDAKTNLDALEGVGVPIKFDATASDVATGETDVFVDALFGTGLDRPVTGALADVIRAITTLRLPTLAIDLPSGIDADTGQPLGVAVRATHTVTFAHPKMGLLTPEGAASSGVLHVVDIGVPPHLVEKVGASAQLVEEGDVASLLLPRTPEVHKFRAGHVGVLAGSPGKIGASLLVARAALRAGAGAATIGTFPEAFAALSSRVLEIMTAEIDPASIADSLDHFLVRKCAIVAGPGFGTDARAKQAIEHVLRAYKGPLVLDADALTLLAKDPDALASSTASLVITPHSGEAARLLGTTSGEVERDRYGAARALAERTKATVLLKGAFSIIAHGDERWVNPTGAPTLATAGSGDVLSGIIGALACSMPAPQAAMAGAFVHGLAGEGFTADRGMLSHEIADRVPAVLRALATAHAERASRHASG